MGAIDRLMGTAPFAGRVPVFVGDESLTARNLASTCAFRQQRGATHAHGKGDTHEKL